jgi:4-alpha-glucanotransferase
VLDPAQYGSLTQPGPALRFLTTRIDKAFAEYDAVRIDHPHGLVCPWVYRSDDPDPARAVRRGARLFSSPDLPDHPGLARFAIVGRAQLDPDPTTPRHADDWVAQLTPEQLDRYALPFDALVARAQSAGRSSAQLVCEVLSTAPRPLRAVLERHGLGRFRVTQKADVRRADDGYRAENAAPADWIMIGNHDTDSLWRKLEAWSASGEIRERARYLAERLVPDPARRARFADEWALDPGGFAQAQLADLFASPARHVLVFFSDLFGIRETFNRPGEVSADNWSLRLPGDYRERYLERVARGRALNLPHALALALRARGGAEGEANADLLRRLDAEASALARVA